MDTIERILRIFNKYQTFWLICQYLPAQLRANAAPSSSDQHHFAVGIALHQQRVGLYDWASKQFVEVKFAHVA